MPAQPFDLASSFGGQVRLFPLSDVVVFPRNILPLHIFESRYREMLEDAMQDDQLIAMATLLPGFEHEYYTRAPIAPIVCIGRVTDYEKTASGTYNLVLLGLRRAELEHEIEPVRSFRRASVKLLEDTASQLDEAAQEVGAKLAIRLRESLPATGQLVEQFVQGKVSLAAVTDVMAFHLPLPVDLKLQLLAETDVLARAQRLIECLPNATPAMRRSNGLPPDFSNN